MDVKQFDVFSSFDFSQNEHLSRWFLKVRAGAMNSFLDIIVRVHGMSVCECFVLQTSRKTLHSVWKVHCTREGPAEVTAGHPGGRKAAQKTAKVGGAHVQIPWVLQMREKQEPLRVWSSFHYVTPQVTLQGKGSVSQTF